MPSLREISAHFPALLIDAASSEIQVGLFGPDATTRWQTSNDEAGVAVFESVEKLGVELGHISTFIFCEGPGSVLGIRTVAMALRTWCVLHPRPMFYYLSLAVIAHELGQHGTTVIADARRDSWHCYRIGAGLRRVGPTELTGELVMPENFRHWSPLPAQVTQVPYSLADMLPRIWSEDLFRLTDSPDAFLHEEP